MSRPADYETAGGLIEISAIRHGAGRCRARHRSGLRRPCSDRSVRKGVLPGGRNDYATRQLVKNIHSRRISMLKGGILWMLGVPLIVVVLLVMFVF